MYILILQGFAQRHHGFLHVVFFFFTVFFFSSVLFGRWKGTRMILSVGLTCIVSVDLFEGKANCYASEVHC